MASVKKRPDGKWRARYRDASGRETARHFDRRIDAQQWLDSVTASVVTGQYVDPRAGRTTVAEYARAWADSQPWRPSTRRRVELDLRVHVLPVLGHRPIADVRPSEVQGLVKGLGERLSPNTVRTVYACVRGLFRAAALDRVIATSPCVRIALPSPVSKHLTIPPVELVWALAAALPARWAAVPIVVAGIGLRPGEVLGLDVADVDFLRQTVTVRQQVTEKRVLGPLKTPASYRTVPLPAVVGEELSRHLAAEGRRAGLFFPAADGRPALLNTFTVAWRRATAAHGATGLRLHDLRHCYASFLIADGQSVKTVQKRMGHASAMVTLDVYGHLLPDSEERTREAVDRWLRRPPPADLSRTAEASPQVRGDDPPFLEKT